MIKILLVEDDADILDLTAYVLRRERFVVVEASDGAQALRRLKADRPDIVVLDLGLPQLDGFEVIRRELLGVDEELGRPAGMEDKVAVVKEGHRWPPSASS